jgi:hypothetical protein
MAVIGQERVHVGAEHFAHIRGVMDARIKVNECTGADGQKEACFIKRYEGELSEEIIVSECAVSSFEKLK